MKLTTVRIESRCDGESGERKIVNRQVQTISTGGTALVITADKDGNSVKSNAFAAGILSLEIFYALPKIFTTMVENLLNDLDEEEKNYCMSMYCQETVEAVTDLLERTKQEGKR